MMTSKGYGQEKGKLC